MQDVKYDGDQDFESIYNQVRTAGSRQAWYDMAGEIRKDIVVRLLLRRFPLATIQYQRPIGKPGLVAALLFLILGVLAGPGSQHIVELGQLLLTTSRILRF